MWGANHAWLALKAAGPRSQQLAGPRTLVSQPDQWRRLCSGTPSLGGRYGGAISSRHGAAVSQRASARWAAGESGTRHGLQHRENHWEKFPRLARRLPKRLRRGAEAFVSHCGFGLSFDQPTETDGPAIPMRAIRPSRFLLPRPIIDPFFGYRPTSRLAIFLGASGWYATNGLLMGGPTCLPIRRRY